MDRVDLLIIDPQNDFCMPSGSLYVKGADDDMNKGAKLIQRLDKKISNIHVTLDSHHFFDVAHPIYWKDSAGKHPNPFTIISTKDVENGVWIPSIPSLTKQSLNYLKELEKSGRYPLCIWPPHCLIGTSGHNVFQALSEALHNWEEQNVEMVDYVTKGSNYTTEHYSAVKAEVPDPADPSTWINTALINTLMEADMIPVMGEASSHCVLNTLRDIIAEFKDDSYVKKLVILEDAMSPVTGFEKQAQDYFQELHNKGVQFSTTDKFLI
jgi:nicotinamidase/pyrazinamidase